MGLICLAKRSLEVLLLFILAEVGSDRKEICKSFIWMVANKLLKNSVVCGIFFVILHSEMNRHNR